jgi:hypothetical protein
VLRGTSSLLYLIVSDIEAAREDPVARSVEISELFDASKPRAQFHPEAAGSVGPTFPFATFSDPDGNTWLFQKITTRLSGRGLSKLDITTLTEHLCETEHHHGECAPKHHWSGWCAAYIVAR